MAATGGIAVVPWYSIGIQYAAASSRRWHVVAPERSVPKFENAFVVRLPTKVCRCDAPGLPGNTIGSSGAWCEKLQFSMKFTPTRSERETPSPSPGEGLSRASAAGPSAAAATSSTAPRTISTAAFTAFPPPVASHVNPATVRFGF